MQCIPLGDSAVTLKLESPDRARAAARALQAGKLSGVVDVTAAFDTVALFYDLASLGISYSQLTEWITRVAERAATPADTGKAISTIEIPVRYGGEFGPDLAQLAASKGLSEDEVIALHTSAEYIVLAVGFLPGFAYLGGLPHRLHAPRRNTPRTQVPAGSVGIGGTYTGVYPFASPAGWNIIGQTSATLFDPESSVPTPFDVGTRVRFIREM